MIDQSETAVKEIATVEDKRFPATVMPDKDWWQALWPEPEASLRSLGIGSGATIVDLCCGDGYFTAPLARIVRSGRVIGVDLDPAMLEQAKIACQEETNCTWIEGDARDLAKVAGTQADVVLIANTFHGVPDKTGLAHAVYSVLKLGGEFIVVNWYPRPREETVVLGQPRGPRTEMRMSPAAVQAVVEPAGLRLKRVVEMPPYHYAAIFGKAPNP